MYFWHLNKLYTIHLPLHTGCPQGVWNIRKRNRPGQPYHIIIHMLCRQYFIWNYIWAVKASAIHTVLNKLTPRSIQGRIKGGAWAHGSPPELLEGVGRPHPEEIHESWYEIKASRNERNNENGSDHQASNKRSSMEYTFATGGECDVE